MSNVEGRKNLSYDYLEEFDKDAKRSETYNTIGLFYNK